MPPTPSSRSRSPSSTRSPTCASRWAPTCRRCRAGSGWTTASARNSSTRAPVMADPASPRTRSRCSRPPPTTIRRCGSSRRRLQVNDARKRAMGRKVIKAMGGDVRGKTVRGARPHLQAQHRRHARRAEPLGDRRAPGCGASVRAYDPEGVEQARSMLAKARVRREPLCRGRRSRCAGDRHRMGRVFAALDLARMAKILAQPLLIDLRNIYTPAEARRAGLRVIGVGKSSAK